MRNLLRSRFKLDPSKRRAIEADIRARLMTNREIASKHQVSPTTVDDYAARLKVRLPRRVPSINQTWTQDRPLVEQEAAERAKLLEGLRKREPGAQAAAQRLGVLGWWSHGEGVILGSLGFEPAQRLAEEA